MDKITSFTINHLKLLPGIYVSRKDTVGGHTVTTFDLRMTRPNYEPVINTAEISYHRTFGRNIFKESRGVQLPCPLFRPHGLPHRFLPAPVRGL